MERIGPSAAPDFFSEHPHFDAGGLPRPLSIEGPDGLELYLDADHAAEVEARCANWHPRPVDLPDWRQWLVDDWGPGGRLRQIAPLLDRVSAGSQHFVIGWEWACAAQAALWFVADEMCDLLAGAAKQFDEPGPILTREMVPDECGLVVFQTPLAGLDATGSGLNCNTGAMVWGPAIWEPTGDEVVGITLYGPGIAAKQYPLMPLGSLVWPYGRTVDDPLDDLPDSPQEVRARAGRLTPVQVASMCEDRRRLAALWLLSSQPNITEPSEPRIPNRAVARRAARAKTPLDARVRIIQLRARPPRDREAPAPGSRTYVHRWIVDGYWRRPPNQPEADRTVYVNGSLRGPAGAPLLAPAEPVKVWKR